MNDFWKVHRLSVGDKALTAFNSTNNTYQDGTTPLYRDTDGRLWGMSGHSHMGAIGVYCGSCIADMRKLYDANFNFCTGHADYAFNGIRYPEGVPARGSVWPFGLYICPNTHRFFAMFHNETGWCGRGTAYDSFGLCETPKGDSDFRHIGLMHSDDEGKSWTFDRWVLTAEKPCYTAAFNPGSGQAEGQPCGQIALGSGDFSLYVDPDGDYMYVYYNIIEYDMNTNLWKGCNVYCARSRKRTDGFFGDFVKYYDGSFCESGIMGKETPIAKNAWHPRLAYSEKYGVYFLTATKVSLREDCRNYVDDVMEIRSGGDFIHFGEPYAVTKDGAPFGNHYIALVSDGTEGQPNRLCGDSFLLLSNHNGTDVWQYDVSIVNA